MNRRRLTALHVIPSLSLKHGGPSYAARAMARALAISDVDVTIATTDDDGDDARLKVPIGQPVKEGRATVHYFRRDILPYKISFGLARWLRSNISEFDILHVHALFSFSSTLAAHYAHRQGVAYIVRPLGVLNRYGLEQRRPFLKKLSMPLVDDRILKHSAAIHYTSEAERAEASQISEAIASHKSVVIPLPVETVKGKAEDFTKRFPQASGKRVVLFLSRIDAKKGVELLLDAFEEVSRQINDVVLVIAGDGSSNYRQALQDRAKQLQIDDRVIWTGHLAGELKSAAFAAANVFVLPSYSENFGIAAAEALACGAPTIVSEQVAIGEDLRANDAGIVVKNDPKELADAIRRLFSDRELAGRLSINGRQLASDRYGLDAVGRQLRQLYGSVLSEKK